MRKALKCLEVFHAFMVFLQRLSKTGSIRRLAFLLMCATCSRLAAATLPAHLTLLEHRFSRFGLAGCSIQKSRFCWYSRKMTTLKKSSAYLCEPDTQSSGVI